MYTFYIKNLQTNLHQMLQNLQTKKFQNIYKKNSQKNVQNGQNLQQKLQNNVQNGQNFQKNKKKNFQKYI